MSGRAITASNPRAERSVAIAFSPTDFIIMSSATTPTGFGRDFCTAHSIQIQSDLELIMR